MTLDRWRSRRHYGVVVVVVVVIAVDGASTVVMSAPVVINIPVSELVAMSGI